MYIKQVIIQGFKSFRNHTVLDSFDPRHNVIVGRNGSGKSNIFCAIEFVLSDEFSQLRLDQRQALLYEGIGPKVPSAYVEIIFDNSDRRLPIDKNEVYLRRIISLKKDQYSLNKKNVTRSDVMNLLESAGFSRTNPYYIVKQGKINQLAMASDSQQLKLLREVAGTRVYDDRRDESQLCSKETEGRLEKTDGFLQTIDEKLQTLKKEKKELIKYQYWDKQRRCLEYIIYERELKRNEQRLEKLGPSRDDCGAKQARLNTEAKIAQKNVSAAIERLKEAKKAFQLAKEERDTLNAEHQQLLEKKTKLTLIINNFLEEVDGDNDSRKKAQQELEKLELIITLREEDLKKIKPKYDEIKRREEECTRLLALKEQKRKELYAKQGRGNKFTNKQDRDRWIRNELKQLTKQIRDKGEHQKQISEDINNDVDKQKNLETKINEYMDEMIRQRASIDDHNKHYYDLTKLKDQCQATRKEQYRKESALHMNLSSLEEDLAKADQSLRFMAGKSIVNGRDSVCKVLETFREQPDMAQEVSSYYGPVIENFDCEKSIYTAVEVVASNRLFHQIVENEKFGTKILEEMNKQRLPGEVTFMPLNRVNVMPINYPDDHDAVPMISKLHYDIKYDRAMRYIFGKTLICRNLEVAVKLARQYGLNCVTLEGHQVSAQGSLTGGYINQIRSRLEIQKTRAGLIAQIDTLKVELAALREYIRDTDQKVSSYVTDMQRTETKSSKARDIYYKIKGEVRSMKEELNAIEEYRTTKERSLAQCNSDLEAMQATKESLESELLQDLITQFTIDDQPQVDTLNDEIRALTKENKEAFTEKMCLEAEKNKLENLLKNNLLRRKDELMLALQEMSLEDRQRQLETSKASLRDIKRRLVKVVNDLEIQNEKVNDASERQKIEAEGVEKWKAKEKEMQEKIETDFKDFEKKSSKQNILQQRIDECTRKINELGGLPNVKVYEKFINMTSEQLLEVMKEVNNNLKEYSHVNKRALDQFVSCNDRKEKLQTQREELDRGNEKLEELAMVLDQRKCEIIENTFKQVSKYFSEIFKKLVPTGHAELVMKIADGEEEDDDVATAAVDFDRLIGISIRVSFSGQQVEMEEMNQLSGGQKSLVAVALIFAIQKCNPAPFYLFDEIDQALDGPHREALANMIHELSSDVQFITTTFRPELLQHANKFYGVDFRNNVSHVKCVSLEEAVDFVKDDSTHG